MYIHKVDLSCIFKSIDLDISIYTIYLILQNVLCIYIVYLSKSIN